MAKPQCTKCKDYFSQDGLCGTCLRELEAMHEYEKAKLRNKLAWVRQEAETCDEHSLRRIKECVDGALAGKDAKDGNDQGNR